MARQVGEGFKDWQARTFADAESLHIPVKRGLFKSKASMAILARHTQAARAASQRADAAAAAARGVGLDAALDAILGADAAEAEAARAEVRRGKLEAADVQLEELFAEEFAEERRREAERGKEMDAYIISLLYEEIPLPPKELSDGSVVWATFDPDRHRFSRDVAGMLRSSETYALHSRSLLIEKREAAGIENFAVLDHDEAKAAHGWGWAGLYLVRAEAWEAHYVRGGGAGGKEEHTMRGYQLTPPTIDFIEDQAWHALMGSRGLNGIQFALVPLRESSASWLPMRAGETNCFVKALSGDLGAMGMLSGKAKKLLAAFEKKHAGGVFPEDVWELEKPLRVMLGFKDAIGDKEWRSGVEQAKRKTLWYVRHDGHCWNGAALPPFPEIAEARTLGGEYDLSGDEPRDRGESLAREAAERKAAILFSATLPRQKLWVVKAALVAEDGTIWRQPRRAAELEDAGGSAALLCAGGLLAWRFKQWRHAEGIEPLRKRAVELWRHSMVEARAWNSLEVCAEETEIDMCGAYLACEGAYREDFTVARSGGQCLPYVREFGFPSRRTQRARVASLEEVGSLTGSVRFLSWAFSADAHPYVSLFANHLAEHDGWMPTPLAAYLWRAGWLESHALEQVEYCLDPSGSIRFPPSMGKKAVQLVGCCSRAASRTSVLLGDPEEATDLFRLMAVRGLRPQRTVEGGRTLLDYDGAEERAQWHHIRAFVLAYLHIGLLKRLALEPGVVRVCVDALSVSRPAAGIVGLAKSPKFGEWRVKAEAPARTKTSAWEHPRGGQLPPTAALAAGPLPARSDLRVGLLVHLDGQGGSGKTTQAVRAMAGRRAACLGKDGANVVELEKTVEAEGAKMPCSTWHSFFHVGVGRACPTRQEPRGECRGCLTCEGWKPARMGKKAMPDVLIWDEVGMVPAAYLRPILEYLAEKGTQVLACGDVGGQLEPFGGGERPADVLEALGARRLEETTDRRAAGSPALQALKLRMWLKPADEALAAMREALPAMTHSEALEAWTPDDLFCVNTRAQGASIEASLLASWGERWPGEEVPMRYRPAVHVSRKKRPTAACPGSERVVPAVVATRIRVPLAAALEHLALPLREWVFDGWRTVHSLQSRTLREGRLFVLEDRLEEDHWAFGRWNKRGAYTAVSRVCRLEQLVRVPRP